MKKNKELAARCERKPLTLRDRQLILQMKSQGYGVRETGRRLGRNHSVVSRFLSSIPYSPYLSGLSSLEKAREMHRRSLEKRARSRKKPRLKCVEIRNYVAEKLKEGWSPELIAGRIRIEHPGLKTNYESIYQWLYSERRDLLEYLLIANPDRKRKRKSKRRKRSQVPADPKRSIEQREDVINTRRRIGDWEGDTIVSRQSKASVFNLVERSSRYMLLKPLQTCSGSAGAAAMISALSPLPRSKRHSITLDNGSENSSHRLVEKVLQVKTYFCHPYCASERGTVENRNGYLRRFLPKKTNLADVSLQELQAIQQKHNHRPMKCLDFLTPHEVFHRI